MRDLPCRVISVGNLTVGGTGKTPVVQFIARHLAAKGLKVAIISRGYRRNSSGIQIVSNGDAVLLDPDMAGDEPFMLAKRLKGIPVIVGSDRYEAGLRAIEAFSSDVIILDDGFQHIALKRDVNILIIDGKKGFGNGNLIPAGPMREPVTEIRRADVLMVSKASGDQSKIIAGLSQYDAMLFKSNYEPCQLVSLGNKEKTYPFERLKGVKVAAVSGIADPDSFRRMLAGLDLHVVSEMIYRDHHSYSSQDVEDIRQRAASAGAEIIITTEKDAWKISRFDVKESPPFYYLEISLAMAGSEGQFMNLIERALKT